MRKNDPEKKRLSAERKRIEAAYYASCRGIAISVLRLEEVFAEGHRVIAEGADDATLQSRLRAFAETIRTN